MNTVDENFTEFIYQQIELYGDDPVISKDFFLKKDKKNVIIQNELLFCEGNPEAELVLITEASRTAGEPLGSFFKDEPGFLLEKILKSINFDRKDVLVCSFTKSDSQNKNDESNILKQTLFHIEKQLESVEPAFILCLGKLAGQMLLQNNQNIDSLHGEIFDYKNSKLLVTYHPEILMSNPALKRTTWEDIQILQRIYNKWKQERT